jgi:hypothetical protein
MGLFQLKKGTPAAKAFPKMSILKDGIGMCLDFVATKRSATIPMLSVRMVNITPIGMFPTATRSPF